MFGVKFIAHSQEKKKREDEIKQEMLRVSMKKQPSNENVSVYVCMCGCVCVCVCVCVFVFQKFVCACGVLLQNPS